MHPQHLAKSDSGESEQIWVIMRNFEHQTFLKFARMMEMSGVCLRLISASTDNVLIGMRLKITCTEQNIALRP